MGEMVMLGIFEAHVHVTAPDGTDYRTMRYAYSRERIERYRDDLIKANEDTINTVTVEIVEK
jgi:hypothetical protein